MTFKLGIFTSVKAFFFPSLLSDFRYLVLVKSFRTVLDLVSEALINPPPPPHTHTHAHAHNDGPPHYGHAHAGNLMVFVLIRKVRKMLVVTCSGRRKVLVS